MEIVLDCLKKGFKGVPVLADISMNIETGNTMLIVGKNGAGKTTILRLILGLYHPDSGQVKIDHISSEERDFTELKNKIGFVNDNIGLFRELNAWDNLEFFHRIYFPDAKGIQRKEDISKALKEMDLYDQKNRNIDFFSRGMKQRLLIARAFLNHPQILLLDEPHCGRDLRHKP